MVGFHVTRGDVKLDPTPRFPRIAASLPPLFAVGGVLLFAGELRLGRLFGEPTQATLSITTLAVALGAASLLALLVRARRAHGPVPWTLLAMVATIPALTATSLPRADAGLYAIGLWCSAWLNGALAWVGVVEVFTNRKPDESPRAAPAVGLLAISTLLVFAATALCALTSVILVPFALLAWALPIAHLGRPADAKADSALVCAPLFLAAALWLSRCAMLRAGALPEAKSLVIAACVCLTLDVVVGLWVARPRALVSAVPLLLVLSAWSVFEAARSEAPTNIESYAAPVDDGQGLRVPYVPRQD